MDFSAEAIARQMTVLDNELFQKVDVSLFLAQCHCSVVDFIMIIQYSS